MVSTSHVSAKKIYIDLLCTKKIDIKETPKKRPPKKLINFEKKIIPTVKILPFLIH